MAAEKLTLANLGGGELSALVDREFVKLCDNVCDPNIASDKVRTITIQIKVKPDKKGQTADVQYAVKSALPGPDASMTRAYIAMQPGSTDITLFGADVRQEDLFKEPLVSEIKPTQKSESKLAAPMPSAILAPNAQHN